MSDIEKGNLANNVQYIADSDNSRPLTVEEGRIEDANAPWWKKHWHAFLADFTETRGVQRVPPEARQPASLGVYVQMISLWCSANLTANHLTLGLLGPSVYGLSFLDSALCSVFGIFVGALCTAYMATFGPQSGNRTMARKIVARYHMGWWPSRICVVLNLVIMLGYGMIDTVVGGQMLSAISGGRTSIVVGVIVVAILSWLLTVFGLPVLHVYERYGWIPQAVALFILIGCAGPYFNTSAPSVGNKETIIANRLSVFALFLSAPSSWASAGADFFVYFPERTSKKLTFLLCWLGLTLGYVFTVLLGTGIASGIKTRAAWAAAHEVSPGAVVVAAFEPLGAFGHFCAVIVMLGVIANNAPGTYACGLGFQCLGSWPLKVPRMYWNTLSVVIYTICGAVGRQHLYGIFQNFLSLVGYWITIWVVITLEEQLIFRRKIGYKWEDWNDRTKLPIGWAALAAFLFGWVGSVLCMDQVYYIGPIAKLIGDSGSDMGLFVGASWAALLFPGLRYLEKRAIGR